MKVGWFHQHQIEAMDPTDTPLEIIRRALPDESGAARRSRLAQFGMGFEKVETTVANLSGGERARLLLNMVAMEAPHLLILDEPTNHLDIDSRRALLDALNDYEGAVILITHDRSLMELVADRLWLAADGTVEAVRRRHGGLRPLRAGPGEERGGTGLPRPTLPPPAGGPKGQARRRPRCGASWRRPRPPWRARPPSPPRSTPRSRTPRSTSAILPRPRNSASAGRRLGERAGAGRGGLDGGGRGGGGGGRPSRS